MLASSLGGKGGFLDQGLLGSKVLCCPGLAAWGAGHLGILKVEGGRPAAAWAKVRRGTGEALGCVFLGRQSFTLPLFLLTPFLHHLNSGTEKAFRVYCSIQDLQLLTIRHRG